VTEVTLRPETAADEPLSRAIYASTREGELARTPWTEEQKAAFLAMQFEAQRSHYRQVNPDGAFDVIVVDGEDAGRLYVTRRPGDIRVVDIALLPAFRGRGIGGALLAELVAEAAASGRKVSIHVEHENPARRLYERLGFVVVEDKGIYLLMECVPPAAS
jgi:ribosomal protein S18 acetylase RimI-like enzyme